MNNCVRIFALVLIIFYNRSLDSFTEKLGELDDTLDWFEMTCTLEHFDKRLLLSGKGIPYKYVVLSSNESRYEYLRGYSSDYNRVLHFNQEGMCVVNRHYEGGGLISN